MNVLIVSADRTLEHGAAQNLGDALLTDAFAGGLATRGVDVRVADFGSAGRADDTVQRMPVRGLSGLSAAVRGADAVVLGGGTLFADDQPGRPFAGLPRLCAATAGLARLHRTPWAAFGVGVETPTRARAIRALRFAAHTGPVWVRDEASRVALGELGAREVRLAADVSLFEEPRLAASAVATGVRRGAVLALARGEARHLGIDLVDRLAAGFGEVRFVSMDQGDDADAAALAPDVRERLAARHAPSTWREAAVAIAGARTLYASRMHAMYLALMTATPLVALAPNAKTEAFASEFGVTTSRGIAELADARPTDPASSIVALDAARRRLDVATEELIAWLAR